MAELGNVVELVSYLAVEFGYSLEQIMEININKLRARYPDGFEQEKSLHRAEGDV